MKNPDGKLYDCGVRLVAGSRGANVGDGVRSGRVEVKHNGVWGSVCSTNWGDKEAEVLCKSIGFAGGNARTTASHGCITESGTECDPAPGSDYDLAVSVGATSGDEFLSGMDQPSLEVIGGGPAHAAAHGAL